MTANPVQKTAGLRVDCLSLPEVFSQSIASASPTVGAAASIPIVFASAGNGTWLTFIVATIGLLLVGASINHFARRSASAGALYMYVARGLGSTAGVLCGWSLTFAYLVLAVALVAGFAHYTNLVLYEFGLQLPSIFLHALCMGLVWYYAYTDIQLSSTLMLILEIVAVGVTLFLAFLVLGNQGFSLDTVQLHLEGTTFSGLGLGTAIAIFCFIGFESAATLGDEAKQPKVNIPRTLIWSVVSLGMFFSFLAYVEVAAFRGNSTPLNESEAPMTVLANLAGVSLLGVGLNVGIAFSMFACALALINAASRISFSLARHHFYPSWMGRAHRHNQTPYAAVTVYSFFVLIFTVVLFLAGLENLSIFAYTGAVATYGCLFTYILMSIAAPVYLSQLGKLRSRDIIVSLLAGFFMLIPVVGSIYPIPPFPFNIFPYIFLSYLAVGGFWLWRLRRRSPQTIQGWSRDFTEVDTP
ncbi:MAG: APC family permease [Microcoleus sp. SIO2G3]|nr:APC family permease [Microcoleus sp. SIO2G3]